MNFKRLLSIFCLISVLVGTASARSVTDFNDGWRFTLNESIAAMESSFDDRQWQRVQLPHDWSSDGPFSAVHASGTGYAPGGIGWYRKHFQLGTNAAGKTIALEFDGVYAHAEVWINGHFVGGRPYGYSSFRCDLTGLVKSGGADNVVAVRVDHSREADSRYYTGSGIYRNVRLIVADRLHIAPWGVYVTTPKVKADSATVRVATTIENTAKEKKSFVVQTDILAPDGNVVATAETKVKSSASDTAPREVTQELIIRQPLRWELDTPRLYRAVSKIICDGTTVDTVTTPFGIREFHFDADKGFFLNGKNLKLKGVCLHHDAGSLGAAVPDPVLERRLIALKEIGVNAIRTSHNPPDPALLDFCDQMGFLVMDEALDEFTPGKNKWVRGWNAAPASRFGYAEIFADWAVRDVQDMVRRDRNHPSIILWSVGNEIDYANDPFSHPVLGDRYNPANPPAEQLVTCAKPLVAAVKALDDRPVTAALATVAMSDAVGLPEVLDVVGYNYQESRYADDHRKYPKRVIYGSENGHPYDAWLAVRDNDYISGQFLWTGVDYLGEANAWPNRANGAGLFDLCGFKKPLAWFRQSLWSTQPMVYACAAVGGERRGMRGVESWNWPSNSTVNVQVFANCPEVALTLNGQLISTRKMSEARRGMLIWQVPFEPGTLKVSGLKDGKEVCQYTLETTAAPSRVELLPDVKQLHANGKDVCQVEFRIVDEQGRRVTDAETEITFELSGPARLLGIGNGNLNSTESCKDFTHQTYQGRGLLILQTTPEAGEITLQAGAPGLKAAKVTLSSH